MQTKILIFSGEEDTPIGAMPGCFRLGWRHGLLDEVRILRNELQIGIP